MTLRPLSDLSAADWIVRDDAPRTLRATLGPSGFASYARLLHRSTSPGERDEGHLNDKLLAALVELLSAHTSTSDECFFALWEGYGDVHGGDAAGFLTAFHRQPLWPGRVFTPEKPPPSVPPAFPPHVMTGPMLDWLGEDHILFGGPLAEAGRWGAASWGAEVPRDINSPNLMWPADHAWFVTTNIDSTWTGIGGSERLITALLADSRLEVVRQRYDEAALR